MIVFRTQVSEEIGFGHLKRSAYLASLIQKRNEIIFLIKKDRVAIRFLEEKGFQYQLIENLDKLCWDSIKSIVFDIRTIDVYDRRLHQKARERQIKIAQITDLGLCQLPVDLLVNCSLSIIEPILPETINLLNGPQYLIMHHKFIHFNKIEKKYRKNIKSILISLGGGVQYRKLRDIIDILYRYNYNLKLTGGFYLKKSAKKILKRIYPRIKFVGRVESLARPLYEADVAIIAAGTTAYEAAAVGTPAFYFYYNVEQAFTAESLEKAGLGVNVSNLKDFDKDKLLDSLKTISFQSRIDMGNRGKQLVCGNGVYGIIDKLSDLEMIDK